MKECRMCCVRGEKKLQQKRHEWSGNKRRVGASDNFPALRRQTVTSGKHFLLPSGNHPTGLDVAGSITGSSSLNNGCAPPPPHTPHPPPLGGKLCLNQDSSKTPGGERKMPYVWPATIQYFSISTYRVVGNGIHCFDFSMATLAEETVS